MASVFSKSGVKELELHMKCCLGDHPLQNPKLLPCQHAFCTKCMKAKVSQGRKEFICPKCQLSIPLTEKEIDQLPDDFLYPILQKTKDNNSYCDMCKFENKNIPGTFQCLDCGDILCDECRNGHTKSRQTRLHRLVSVKEIQSGKYKTELEVTKQHLCETHSKPNQPQYIERYCEECQCLACQICVFTQHHLHTCQTINEMHEKKTKVITDHVTRLLDLNQLDKVFVADLEQGQGQNKKLQEKLENDVYDRAALIIDIVEKVKQDKLTEIKGHFEKEGISSKTKLEETKNRIIRTDSIVSFTQTFLEHSDKAEFLLHEHEIMKKLDDQQQGDRSFILNAVEIGEPQIEKIEGVISEAFGEIRIKTEKRGIGVAKDDVDAPREWMEEPQVLFSINSGIGSANDLTVTENEDIVAVNGSAIQVYNSEGKPFDCSKLEFAWNVVARGDTLYVIRDNANVLVMDFKGNVQKTITLPGQGHDCKGLAIDNEGTVYISSHGTNTIYKCKSDETNAEVFIQEGTHPDLKGPWYLCITPSLEVVVSTNDSECVQVYNRNGEFLWQYKGQGDMSLIYPMGVCCDSKGYIYISDCGKSRIQVVKNGESQKCIIRVTYGIAVDKEDNIICSYGGKIEKLKLWK